jgi:hypothetical protein
LRIIDFVFGLLGARPPSANGLDFVIFVSYVIVEKKFQQTRFQTMSSGIIGRSN